MKFLMMNRFHTVELYDILSTLTFSVFVNNSAKLRKVRLDDTDARSATQNAETSYRHSQYPYSSRDITRTIMFAWNPISLLAALTGATRVTLVMGHWIQLLTRRRQLLMPCSPKKEKIHRRAGDY